MNPDTFYTITDKTVFSNTKKPDGTYDEVVKSAAEFYAELAKTFPFTTGLMPSDGNGVIQLRSGEGYIQVAYQKKAGTNEVNIRKNGEVQKVWLSQPNQIFIVDFKDGQLIGIRQFYTIGPVKNIDDPMYFCNLPGVQGKVNENEVNRTSLGVVLDLPEDVEDINNMPQAVAATRNIVDNLVYDATAHRRKDLIRFYRHWYATYNAERAKAVPHLYNLADWTKATEEGVDFSGLDVNDWIPFNVPRLGFQLDYDPGADTRTFKDVCGASYILQWKDNLRLPARQFDKRRFNRENNYNERYAFHNVKLAFDAVEDEIPLPKPVAQQRDQVAMDIEGIIYKDQKYREKPVIGPEPLDIHINGHIRQYAFRQNPAEEQAERRVGEQAEMLEQDMVVPRAPQPQAFRPQINCPECGEVFYQDDPHLVNTNAGAYICQACAKRHYNPCADCGEVFHYGDLQLFNEQTYCRACRQIVFCLECGHAHDQPEQVFGSEGCVICTDFVNCSVCNLGTPKNKAKEQMVAVPGSEEEVQEIVLCKNCAAQNKICACGYLRDADAVMPLDAEMVCGPCTNFTEHGVPFFQPVEIKAPNLDLMEQENLDEVKELVEEEVVGGNDQDDNIKVII